ncbi:MAG: hypothetical protein P8J61_05575 [Gammaproteobacteria bacterium]|nr:hypothetical protein [Gammaproteobacteria bacterium]
MIKQLLCLAIFSQAIAVHAQETDIVGYWNQPAPGWPIGGEQTALWGFLEDAMERSDGPALIDFLGLPINEEGLSRALTYDGALLGVPEHVCMRHPAPYNFWGPASPRIASQFDYNLDVISYTLGGTFRRADRTIWMDGRDHPSEYAPHTWAGFTTGHWENGTLITKTTHIKWGWIRRNGVPSSDQATVHTYYQRNNDVLTITWFVDDPIYLSDTFIRSADFVVAPRGITTASFGVEAADSTTDFFTECLNRPEIARPVKHYVPHYLPGENPFVGDLAEELGVPVEATLGGAETAYPEYKEMLKE